MAAVRKADRSGTAAQLSFKVPPALKAKLEAAASNNARSLTSEVLSRLEVSLAADSTPSGTHSPDFAEEVARRVLRKLLKATEL
jgi:hypothetical protein